MDNFGQNGVLSFHYYDAFGGFGYVPEKIEKYKADLKEIFTQLSLAATNHGLVPLKSLVHQSQDM